MCDEMCDELQTELLLLKRPGVFERIIAGGPGAELELAKLEWRARGQNSDPAEGIGNPSVESTGGEDALRRLVELIDRQWQAAPRCEGIQLPLPLSYAWPIHSRMACSEANALLTEPGTWWFLSQATGLPEDRVARLCGLGMPWPIDRPADLSTEECDIRPEVRPEGLVHLDRLFRRPRRLSSHLQLAHYLGIELQELEALIGPPEVSHPIRVPLPTRDWRDIDAESRATPHCETIADVYNEDVDELQMVADALVAYSSCLILYGHQCMVNRAERTPPSECDPWA